MEVIIRPGRYPYEWDIEFNIQGWATASLTVLAGVEPYAGELISHLFSRRMDARLPSTCDEVVQILNDRMSEIQDRRDSGGDFVRATDLGIKTFEDVATMVSDFLDASFYLLSSGLESLSRDELALATRAFQLSAGFHGQSCVIWELLTAELDAPPSGPALALASRRDQVLKPEWQAHCRAILKSGRNVSRLNDLLDVAGYPAEVMKIKPPTLKKWARECGFDFQAGRPAER